MTTKVNDTKEKSRAILLNHGIGGIGSSRARVKRDQEAINGPGVRLRTSTNKSYAYHKKQGRGPGLKDQA